ncbi:MAG: hypothetical protein D3923_15345 [Candidatus Electrothrix sp. AR3]|nr:hypothetical protein [Candidatus Electrothrix sp. AR3]
MQVILLPGMDGTGILFKPLLKEFSEDIDVRALSYPCDTKLSYSQLVEYVRKKLPEREDFILVAESFSGPIGYFLASNPPSNLKAADWMPGNSRSDRKTTPQPR